MGVVDQSPRPDHQYTQERPGTEFTGGWVGPRASLEVRNIPSPPGIDPGPSSSQSVAIPTELTVPRIFISMGLFTISKTLPKSVIRHTKLVSELRKFSPFSFKYSHQIGAQWSHLWRKVNINCVARFSVQRNIMQVQFVHNFASNLCSDIFLSVTRIQGTNYTGNHMHKLMLIIIDKKFRFHKIDSFVALKCICRSPALSSTSAMSFSYFSLNSVAAFFLMYELYKKATECWLYR